MVQEDVVRVMIRGQQPVQIPPGLFKDQAWLPHDCDPPFEFEVVDIGIVHLNTPIRIQHGHAVVLHSMGSNARLQPSEWITMPFKHILFQDRTEGMEKRMQMLRLCEKQPERKSRNKARILLERVGEVVVYDDVSR